MIRCILITFTFVILHVSTYAQRVNQGEIKAIRSRIVELIREDYVDEKVAHNIIDSLQATSYSPGSIVDFAGTLNRDLRRFSHDKHFEIMYSKEDDFSKAITSRSKEINFGFTKLEILSGNIGYLRLSAFEDPSIAGKVATGSMDFLSNANAIIIDLRDNSGGRKAMVQLLLSYFFQESSKHLYTIQGRREEFYGYTEVELPGPKMPDVPLYVLVNSSTFSAAEMFAFILKKQGRATLVGTTTAGGGHTVANYEIGSHLSMNLPVGKVVEAVSKKGWDRIGVTPDIEAKDGVCLERAYLTALEREAEGITDPAQLFKLQWQMDILQSILDPVTIDQRTLESYAGIYGRRIVTYDKGGLFYQGRAGIEKAAMIPVDSTTFRFREVDFFRVRFIVDGNGNVIRIEGLYRDGYVDASDRGNEK